MSWGEPADYSNWVQGVSNTSGNWDWKYTQPSTSPWTTSTSVWTTTVTASGNVTVRPQGSVELEKDILAAPVVGVRAFRLNIIEGGLLPLANFKISPWAPGVNEAECLVHPEHSCPPVAGCMCGFWSAKDTSGLIRAGHSNQGAYAVVEQWGRVIEHEHGHRSQFARVKEILLVPFAYHKRTNPNLDYDEFALEMTVKYGCPVVWNGFPHLREMLERNL